jgi:hypothetical protein
MLESKDRYQDMSARGAWDLTFASKDSRFKDSRFKALRFKALRFKDSRFKDSRMDR